MRNKRTKRSKRLDSPPPKKNVSTIEVETPNQDKETLDTNVDCQETFGGNILRSQLAESNK